MTRLLTIVLLCVCLVQIDTVTVPSRSTFHKDLRFVKYDAERRLFSDYGIASEAWCRQAVNGSVGDICSHPDFIPAKDDLVFSLREDLFKEEKWQYLATGAIYLEQARRPSRQKNEFGKTSYVFDCNALPFTPPGMRIVMHNGGQFEWDPQKVKLSSLKHGQDGRLVRGYDFLRALAGQKILNGTALEYLVSSPFLIPWEWRGRRILFSGTVYADHAQMYYCSVLSREGLRWIASFQSLDYGVYASSFSVAVLV